METHEETAGNGREKKRKPVVEIREMEVDDIPAVFHMGEKLFTSNEAPNLYRTWDEYEVTGFFHEEPELCLVAEYENNVVGFALGTMITKSHSAWKYGYLNWLGVHPGFRRLGIATRLLKVFRDAAIKMGARILMVDTEDNNRDAINFFSKFGFGHPEKHVYLSMNLDSHVKQLKQKQLNNHHKISAPDILQSLDDTIHE